MSALPAILDLNIDVGIKRRSFRVSKYNETNMLIRKHR